MVTEIHLSIALVTRNRPRQLERCLRSLRGAGGPCADVVVSDDSDEGFVPITRKAAERFGCVYLQGPRRGLYANRNFAASQCRGTHIATADDDHEFPPGHWQCVRDAVAGDPEAVWVIGEFYEWRDVKKPFPTVPEIQPRGHSFPPRNLDASMAIADGATIYPCEVLSENRMLEQFPFGNAYLEFGARLKARGYRIRQLSTTYIIHHYFEGPRSYNLPRVHVQTAFLAAALAYGVYFPSWCAMLECWGYFTVWALINEVQLAVKGSGKDVFGFAAWWETVRLYHHYRQLFLSGAWGHFS